MTAMMTKNVTGNVRYYRLMEMETGEFLGRCLVTKLPHRYEFWDFRIFEEFQGKGYGTLMLKEIIKRYTKYGKPLVLYVYKNNDIAIHLYKKLGFEITRSSHNDKAWEMQYRK